MDQGSSLAKPLYLRDSVNRLPNLNLTPDPAGIPLNLWALDLGSSLAKYGVDLMMHHQLNKLTDLTPDPPHYLRDSVNRLPNLKGSGLKFHINPYALT